MNTKQYLPGITKQAQLNYSKIKTNTSSTFYDYNESALSNENA